MKRSNFLFFGIIFFFFRTMPCAGQLYYSVVGTTWVDYATAYSNGYKIVPAGSIFFEETLYAVYSYHEDTCYFAYSYDRGETWKSRYLFATVWENAHCPSLDVYGSLPYVVSEGDSAGKGEIFLKCPFDYCIPQRISYTTGHSTLPAIMIDTSRNMHIVWQDDTPGNWEIYYCCAQYQAGVSDVVNLSNHSEATDIYPSISIYNGVEVHVTWERYDPTIYCPYCVVHRYRTNDTWSEEEFLAGCTGIPLHHPSLDYSHGEDSLSATWEDSSLGKSDAHFYGGNGGGFLTPGDSRYPVVSTMNTTWSYLYWEDNSDGYDDIYAHCYYRCTDWRSYKFRDVFGDEAMHHPSVANCYVVWTQGDSAPYRVMFCCEGYPIGVEENQTLDSKIPKLEVYPNPFIRSTIISLSHCQKDIQFEIYDLTGRLVRTLPGNHRIWDGRNSQCEEVQSGIYFVRGKGHQPVKVIKLK